MDKITNQFPNAQWMWLPDYEHDERDRRINFRREFDLKIVPETVVLNVTADARYTLCVNGEFINHGPARGFQKKWPFDRLEIAPFLQKGKNVIAVMAYQYGISHFSYSYEHASGLLVAGFIDCLNFGSGLGWKAQDAPGYIRAVARASIQYCYQEFFDCQATNGDWRQVDYDDSHWTDITPEHCRNVGSLPWHEFEKRSIPLLTKDIIKPRQIVARANYADYKIAPNWMEHQNIGLLHQQEEYAWQQTSGDASSVCFDPETIGMVIDFGQEVVGMLNFQIENEHAGEMVDFIVCESLSGHMPDLPNKKNGHRIISFAGRLILKQGVNQHELTLPWGFRYLILICRGKNNIKVQCSVRQTIYPLEIQGNFNSSDEKLNAIWRTSEHTQRCCMVDAYIDCPWRENAQWWGDGLVQSQNTFRLSADSRLLERGLRQIAEQKTPNGLTYGMAPTCGHNCVLPDYSAMWIVSLYAQYWQTGKTEMWLELRDTVDGIFEYFKGQLADDGLLYNDNRYWLFLDWCPALHKNGAPTVLNLIYLWALQSALKLAQICNDTKRIGYYECAINKIEQAIKNSLYDINCGYLYDGLTFDGNPVKKYSPHAAALAIITNVMPEQHQLWREQILLPLIRGTRDAEIMPSSYFIYYIFEAMNSGGYGDDVIDCIRRWWSDFLDEGCSTTPENWLEQMERGYGSFCHAWSAHPLVYFSQIVLGVQQIAPDWREIVFNPVMRKGQKSGGTVPTPHGLIQVQWDWTGNTPEKNILLPSGIKMSSTS